MVLQNSSSMLAGLLLGIFLPTWKSSGFIAYGTEVIAVLLSILVTILQFVYGHSTQPKSSDVTS